MKIAVSGKGGVGKTTIAAALAQILRKKGRKVIAIDADMDSNLSLALGHKGSIKALIDYEDLINERVGEGGIISFNPKVDDIADKISTDIGGIKLIVLGRVREANSGCFCAENSLLKAFISHIVLEDSQEVIIDMSAGIEHLSRGVAEGIDLMLVVIEPGKRSIETAKKINKMCRELKIKNIKIILNKDNGSNLKADIKIPFNPSLVLDDLNGKKVDFEFIEKHLNIKFS